MPETNSILAHVAQLDNPREIVLHTEWRVVGDFCNRGETTGRTHESAPLHNIRSIERAIARLSAPRWRCGNEKQPFYRNVRVQSRKITVWKDDAGWPVAVPLDPSYSTDHPPFDSPEVG